MTTDFLSLPLAPASAEWGPPTNPAEADRLFELPYHPFHKGERLGKINMDWGGKGGKGAYSTRGDDDGDVEEFQTVDVKQKSQTRKQAPWGGARHNTFSPGGRHGGRNMQGGRWSHGRYDNRGGRGGGRGDMRRREMRRPAREPSHAEAATYQRVASFPFQDLSKLALSAGNVPRGQDVRPMMGSLFQFDTALVDRVPPELEMPGEGPTRFQVFDVETTQDPVIQELAKEFLEEVTARGDSGAAEAAPAGGATAAAPGGIAPPPTIPTCVFASELALAMLMCATKSVLSWDLLVSVVVEESTRFVFITVRREVTEMSQPVNETNPQLIPLNTQEALELSQEAIHVNLLTQLAVQKKQKEGAKPKRFAPHPFASEDDTKPPFPVSYKYRRWDPSPTLRVVARCQVDGLSKDKKPLLTLAASGGGGISAAPPKKAGDGMQYRAFAFHEVNPSETKWKEQFSRGKSGLIQVQELKNNTAKAQRWTACAFLANVERVYLGYVTRVDGKNPQHQLLYVESLSPAELAQQCKVSPMTMWAQGLEILNRLAALEEGDYVLMKDPTSAVRTCECD